MPAELEVHVILDTSPPTRPPRSTPGWYAHQRFHFQFAPTYAPRMNLVERWFSALTTKNLQRSAHHSVKALAADIREWVQAWNENPKPFTWHKTAEEILDRLAGYCTAINKWSMLRPDRKVRPYAGRVTAPLRCRCNGQWRANVTRAGAGRGIFSAPARSHPWSLSLTATSSAVIGPVEQPPGAAARVAEAGVVSSGWT